MEPRSFEENILYLTGEITRLAHKRITAIFNEKQFGVTVEQFGVLAVLWYEEGINQQTLSARLNRDKTTVARIVNNMIKKSLIVRIPDQLDKRNKLIYLTEKGRELQKDSIDSTGVVYMDAIKDLEKSDIMKLTKTLRKMMNNLNT